jgi:hypothetical protein
VTAGESSGGDAAAPGADALRAAVDAAARRYFAERRARVDGFVARVFSVRGALRLHRRALGWDILKAPANLALAPFGLALRAGAGAARAAGLRGAAEQLGRPTLTLDTAVAREVRRLVMEDLLELPTDAAPGRDALAAAIAGAPEVRALLPAGAEAALDRTLADYAGARAAVGEMTATLATLGVGAAALHKATPGALTLGPALAGAMAQAAAVSAFPLGATAGAAWYAVFPAAASPALVAGATAATLGVGALAAAFAGVVADPVQARLGVHRRRLLRLIDTLEGQFMDGREGGFAAREHYLARLADIADAAAAAAGSIRL